MLYAEQEEALVRRGILEEELMTSIPLDTSKPNIRGANTQGGFATKSKTTNASQKALSKAYAKILRKEGVLRIDDVLPSDVADDLRAYAMDLRKRSLEDVSSGTVGQLHRFANVLLRDNRCDLLLPLNDDVYTPFHEVICQSAVGQTIAELLGKQAVLYELSCLISDPGSQRQVVHPDTPVLEGHDAVLYSAFVALQDVAMDMGPTCYIPGTHTEEIHDIFKNGDKDTLLMTQPSVLGIIPKGTCCIFDSRLLHCGTANQADTSRALFYFSFKNPKVLNPGNPGSIRPELIGKLSFSLLKKELDSRQKGNTFPKLDALSASMV